jgi:hypothetical protein
VYHGPVFVLTHHERESVTMEGGTTFHFFTGGIEEALERAKEAAGDDEVSDGPRRRRAGAGRDELDQPRHPHHLPRGQVTRLRTHQNVPPASRSARPRKIAVSTACSAQNRSAAT